MKLRILQFAIGVALLCIGCFNESTSLPTEPPSLIAFAGSISGGASQNGSAMSIICNDSSSDPAKQVVGVRWSADQDGTGFQVSELGSLGRQTSLDVTGGGPGTYDVKHELIDVDGNVVASDTYSVTVS